MKSLIIGIICFSLGYFIKSHVTYQKYLRCSRLHYNTAVNNMTKARVKRAEDNGDLWVE